MVTESGWHSNAYIEYPSTPETQSRYVVQLYTQSMAANVEVMIYLMLNDVGDGYIFKSGLVTNVDDIVSPLVTETGIRGI